MVVLTGPFTDADLRRLAEAMRACERGQPEALFRMIVDDPSDPATLERAAALVDELFPKLPGDDPIKRWRPR